MAKTTKPVPKRTTSSSSKKQGFLKRSFNLKSRKVQFFIVILIVAVLGGGYYTYKSFAAVQSWSYTISQGNLALDTAGSSNRCKGWIYNEPAKNNKPVWSLSCPKYDGKGAYPIAAVMKGAYLPNSSYRGYYRSCAYIKGRGTIRMYMSAPAVSNTKYHNVNASNYQYYCTDTLVLNPPYAIYADVGLSTSSQNPDGGWINVGSMVLERVR